jgi:ATP-dependent DNA helicase RecQ
LEQHTDHPGPLTSVAVNPASALTTIDLHSLLKQFFGFTSFRPLQEEIICDVLAGRDVFAVLPTGGGKSLCFQLPALARPGLTVVVSPLIALMKDQVDALRGSGIPATYLNSSIELGEARTRIHGVRTGEVRLLYIAPERLLMAGTLADLQQCNVTLLAIDEAHCISEWGHDFRPEYRQLASLRDIFPSTPIMALTATATERVRADIVRQLKLRQPNPYVASFNRPNLTYRVVPKSKAFDQVLHFVRARPDDSGIIYCQARDTTETVARDLAAAGIPAKAYHAGLSAAERSRNQELFLRDEVRIICATIAFGMGINKPNVRYVLHYDVPKNIEGYYQETGRAGRDGLPSECLLLFSAGDLAKYSHFINEKREDERRVARDQLRRITHYAESAECRRRFLLRYFGEQYVDENCGGCDNCLEPREKYDATTEAQKLLSCVYRVRQKTGLDFGVNHVIQVLVGADTEAIRKWGHESLSTYGIGGERSREEWFHTARELIRLGLLEEIEDEKFTGIGVTEEGFAALKDRRMIELLRPAKVPGRQRAAVGLACDEVLLERLGRLRKRLAEERATVPHNILPDIALLEMAQRYTSNEADFAKLTGVSDKKLRDLGAIFLNEIAAHLRDHPRQQLSSKKAPIASDDSAPYDEKLFERLREVRREIAHSRGVPAYVILHDSALRGIARHLPCMQDELANIRNIGPKRAADFGAAFLAAVSKYKNENVGPAA